MYRNALTKGRSQQFNDINQISNSVIGISQRLTELSVAPNETNFAAVRFTNEKEMLQRQLRKLQRDFDRAECVTQVQQAPQAPQNVTCNQLQVQQSPQNIATTSYVCKNRGCLKRMSGPNQICSSCCQDRSITTRRPHFCKKDLCENEVLTQNSLCTICQNLEVRRGGAINLRVTKIEPDYNINYAPNTDFDQFANGTWNVYSALQNNNPTNMLFYVQKVECQEQQEQQERQERQERQEHQGRRQRWIDVKPNPNDPDYDALNGPTLRLGYLRRCF